jgi:RND family efflux transporter MFP subunit
MKIIGRLIGIAMWIGLGFIIRGFIPAGGPPSGMMGMDEMPPPAVVAVELKEVPLDVLEDHIATVEPVQDVIIRSEVSGYIDQVHFKEGSRVAEGELLFTVNQNQYRAAVSVKEAELERAKAELIRSEKYLKRLQSTDIKSISAIDLETAESDHLQARAMLLQAKASLELANIDLGYSEIRAPIGGRIGKAMLTKGNYVSVAAEVLARIVQTDPIRVSFSMTDRSYLDLRSLEQNRGANGLIAQVRLPNGDVLKTIGKKDFEDNTMNPETGTMAFRYIFDNPDGLLVAGGYVNILLGQPERPMGLRLPQKAIMLDPEGAYVLTTDTAGLIGTARVELGKTIEGDRIVLSGLKAGDRVVVEGVQKVQPGMTAMVTLQGVEQ